MRRLSRHRKQTFAQSALYPATRAHYCSPIAAAQHLRTPGGTVFNNVSLKEDATTS